MVQSGVKLNGEICGSVCGIFWNLTVLSFENNDTVNPQNKSKKFNSEPSIRYKRKTVEEHSSHHQHIAAIEAELLRRVSVFHHQVNYREQVKEDFYHKTFSMLYWVAKEELANCKFVCLLELVEELGVSNIKLFQHRSSGSVREMFLLLGKMIKEHVVKRALKSNCFGPDSSPVISLVSY